MLSWNVHGRRYITKTNFKKIVPALEEHQADVLCLQEADEVRTKLHRVQALSDYDAVIPTRGFNHNIILSRFPIKKKGELEFPRMIRTRMENAIWADIQIHGRIVRIYNCHFSLIGAGPSSRERQLHFILDHADTHDGPVIVCGDFNTSIPHAGLKRTMVQLFHFQTSGKMHVEGEHFSDDERYAMVKVAEKRGFREAADITRATWRIHPFPWELFRLKLDWFLVRGIETPQVDLHPYISDHRAIHATCLLK